MLLIAILVAVAYTGFSGFTVYRNLDTGARELAAAQADLSLLGRAGGPQSADEVVNLLRQAERDFQEARTRAQEDPAFRVGAGIPPASAQIAATARLGAIGADISRAGQSAAVVAGEVDGLRQRYTGKALTPQTLPAALKQAEGIAASYAASARTIGDQLRAAHSERAAVRVSDLIQPLQTAYAQVDSALTQADTAFSRYQDVRRLLSDQLGVAIP